MFSLRFTPFQISVLLIGILIIGEAYGRSGCAAFGHSCYGGMGKRSDLENANEEVLQDNLHQDPENRAYTYTGAKSLPLMAGFPAGLFKYSRFTPEQYEQMNKFVREWIINYLRKEEIEKK